MSCGQCRWALCAADHRLEKMADRQVQQALAGVFKKFAHSGVPGRPAVGPRCAAAVARGPPWDGGSRHPMATAPWASYAPDADQSMLAGASSMGAPRSDRARSWTCPAEYTADKATGAVAHRAAGAASWRHQLGHVSPEPTALGGQSRHASRSGRWSCQTGPALRSGVLRCGRCGRKLQVVYRGTTGRVPRDVCRGGRVDRGSSSCLTVGGRAGGPPARGSPGGVHGARSCRDGP